MAEFTRRDFLKGTLAGGLVVAAQAVPAQAQGDTPAASPSVPAGPPNVLIVHCHDLGQYLHCYGVKTVQSPFLDAFAAEGVRFSRSFSTTPGCSPSRASIFTGRYPHNNGVLGLTHMPFGWDLNPDEIHLAGYLKEAGYATAAIGIVHETHQKPSHWGYEHVEGHSKAQEAADRAIAYLEQRQQAQDGRPFFLSVGFIEPHRLPYPVPPAELPKDHGFPGPHLEPDDSLGVEVPGYLKPTEGTRRELAGLQGAVKHVDAQFGRIVARLETLGLKDRTLVIFTTDHGVAMPRAKCSLYEPGVTVAFMLRWPGRAGWNGGRVMDAMISQIDHLPTILDAAGVPVPERVQGRSLAPLLDGNDYTPREAIFTEITYHDYYDPRRAVRTDRWKLIANFSTAPAFMDPSQQWRPQSETNQPPNPATATHTTVELFDLENDPWEQQDLADSAEHQTVRAEMMGLLYRQMVATDDPLLDGAVTGPQHRTTVALLAQASQG